MLISLSELALEKYLDGPFIPNTNIPVIQDDILDMSPVVTLEFLSNTELRLLCTITGIDNYPRQFEISSISGIYHFQEVRNNIPVLTNLTLDLSKLSVIRCNKNPYEFDSLVLQYITGYIANILSSVRNTRSVGDIDTTNIVKLENLILEYSRHYKQNADISVLLLNSLIRMVHGYNRTRENNIRMDIIESKKPVCIIKGTGEIIDIDYNDVFLGYNIISEKHSIYIKICKKIDLGFTERDSCNYWLLSIDTDNHRILLTDPVSEESREIDVIQNFDPSDLYDNGLIDQILKHQ